MCCVRRSADRIEVAGAGVERCGRNREGKRGEI